MQHALLFRKLESYFAISCLPQNEIDRPTEHNHSVETVRRACTIGLDRFQQRVLATRGDHAKDENPEVVIVAGVENGRGEQTDENRQDDGKDVLRCTEVPIDSRK